jgi:hypothetical protein
MKLFVTCHTYITLEIKINQSPFGAGSHMPLRSAWISGLFTFQLNFIVNLVGPNSIDLKGPVLDAKI